nr:hypothetical protein GCM10020093_049340 [Planobispora longispora]
MTEAGSDSGVEADPVTEAGSDSGPEDEAERGPGPGHAPVDGTGPGSDLDDDCQDPPADDHVDLLVRDFDLDTLVAVRHEVEHCAEQHGLTGLTLYRFVVAINEITTNAVRHGGGTGRLRLWRAGDRIYCEVTDRGPGLSVSAGNRAAPVESANGRGLWLARRGVRRFTMRTGAGGTSITLEAT